MFQTPSARGGIPLSTAAWLRCTSTRCFKPLQRGAGFLCRRVFILGIRHSVFQTPSARGGIPLSWQYGKTRTHSRVSNPFSAGRDSSVESATLGERSKQYGFKPLQRGAGFLWWRRHPDQDPDGNVSNPFSAGRDSSGQYNASLRPAGTRFKPLQRGAGFLWRQRKGAIHGYRYLVSNPFSAGRDSSGVRITGRAVWRTTRRHRSITIARSAQRSLCMWPGSPIMLV